MYWKVEKASYMALFAGIYGVGAVVLILTLKYFNKNNYTLFFGGCLIGSIVEYIMSFLGEVLFDARWWDYSNRFLNINGRICLLYAIFWGILSLILMRIINPKIDKIIDYAKSKINLKILKAIIYILSIFMLINALASGIAVDLFLVRISIENNIDIKNEERAIKLYEEVYSNPKISEFIYKFWGDKKMITTFPNIKIRTKANETVYVKDLLPEIKPYFYKF